MIPVIDHNKVGTLILGYYRNGTHFLKDVIVDQYPSIQQFDEVCNDNTMAELEKLTWLPGYKICILNNSIPKFFLVGRRDLLEKWFVVTGCPMLLNTSLNIRGEPMVNDRADADRFEKLYKIKVIS